MDKGMVDALPAESSVSFKQHTPKWRERTKKWQSTYLLFGRHSITLGT